MNRLTIEQLEAIELGQLKRKGLLVASRRAAKRALNTDVKKYLDTLISGDSGIGKTFNITRELDKVGVNYYQMTGNSSIFGFMGNLMLLHATKPKGERLVIFLDDCDFLLEPKNLNITKNLTATNPSDRKFEYSMKVMEKNFTEAQQSVLPNYLKDGEHGLIIPCDDFIFIISSNIVLPDETMTDTMSDSAKLKYQHYSAIRGRMKPYEIELGKESKWGWLYDVAMNDGALDMLKSDEDKLELLNFVWDNWGRMKETSIRTIEKMGYDRLEDDEDYADFWEIDYLKS